MSEEDPFIVQLLMTNTLGLSILCETLKVAARYPLNASCKRVSHQVEECYCFIQGSGLDNLLVAYGLDYNPYYIREVFNDYLGHKNGRIKDICYSMSS